MFILYLKGLYKAFKKIMVSFIDLWPCLFTPKLFKAKLSKWDHSSKYTMMYVHRYVQNFVLKESALSLLKALVKVVQYVYTISFLHSAWR